METRKMIDAARVRPGDHVWIVEGTRLARLGQHDEGQDVAESAFREVRRTEELPGSRPLIGIAFTDGSGIAIHPLDRLQIRVDHP